MPIRYRRYYIQKLIETIEVQNTEINKKFSGNKGDSELAQPSKNYHLPQSPILQLK
jgi:hypothetical protein